MKRLFVKASKPSASANKSLSSQQPPAHSQTNYSASPIVHTPILQPKYVVPPVPHPYPHDHLAILATKDGLLIRPHIPSQVGGSTANLEYHIRLSWGKSVNVEQVPVEGEGGDWTDSAIIYGIVGILELYSSSYILVITSRSESGSLLDVNHKVYGIKTVIAIPLLEERAKPVIKGISLRNLALARASLLPQTSGIDSASDEVAQETQTVVVETPSASSPHVQFSSENQVKLVTLVQKDIRVDPSLRPESPYSTASSASTPSLDQSPIPPILKAVTTRLSFWNKTSKRDFGDLPVTQGLLKESKAAKHEQDALDQIIQDAAEEPAEVLETILSTAAAPPQATTEERHSELEDKVIRECIREFTKGDMYFSYTFDITHSLEHKHEQMEKYQKQEELLAGLGALPPKSDSAAAALKLSSKSSTIAEPYPTLPLWRRVDKHFWWNEWMLKLFIDAGLHSYILPIMQGYFQTAHFMIPSELGEDEECHVNYTVVSRRSRDRAGLRYQRRGVDDEAHVANFVETETIVRVEREARENIFSYVQIRGSIPLFWEQTGPGLKPPPVLSSDRSREQNMDALRRHLKRTVPLYGPHTIVNLTEQHGKEGTITQTYHDYVQELNLQDVKYHGYDFHAETKGMKYENISKLIDAMDRVFDGQGYFWICDNTVLSRQKGIFRVNCIDCLDRTNVVQSAFARHVLGRQLGALALLNPMAAKYPGVEFVFNDLWANNGDAISRAYAGTSALKGDFTRTGKRDLSGLLNDGVNSLARMYTSTFSDWFSQAVIDFMLGNRTISVFSEFLLKLQSSDPRDLIRLSKIRTEAIATSVARVLPEGEGLLSGWTLFSPEELNSKLGLKFEEKVLLLTMKALYIVSYDYTLEKVKLYTRVPLGDITGISKGAYILSPLEEASRDPDQNAGFIVSWMNWNQESRASSYCLRNSFRQSATDTYSHAPASRSTSKAVPLRLQTWSAPRKNSVNLSRLLGDSSFSSAGTGEKMFTAFKALPLDPTRIRRGSSTSSGPYSETSEEVAGASSCREVVDSIVNSISCACEGMGIEQSGFVTNEDVVSLAEAQRTTTMYAKVEYGLKRLLWLGAS